MGRPVVPDEYIIGAPSCSSATGRLSWPATTSSQSSKGASGAPWVPVMNQYSTSGQRAGSSAATAALLADVITARDPESLTM